jgi:lipid-A-disaccharide synthase
LKFCKADIQSYRPDAVILIDYPGFNLRVARFLHELHIKVLYYISPQVWAWKASRVFSIKKTVDRMFVILPFEKEFYQKYHYNVEFVGHPLLDVIPGDSRDADRTGFLIKNNLDDKPIVAVLPGSRKMEIGKVLKQMIGIRDDFKSCQFVVAGAPSLEDDFYKDLLQNTGVKFVRNQTYELLRNSRAALVTSGTATLETALWEVPQVVCYKGNWLSYQIARRLVQIPYISLVNLISGKPVVTELIQDQLSSSNLSRELSRLLFEEDTRTSMLKQYKELKILLGGAGASARTAESMVQYLRSKSV